MFTGIIESNAKVLTIEEHGTGKIFHLTSNLGDELKVDQSVSHNGVCLTVESVNGKEYQVTAIKETLDKTNMNSWTEGATVNLERCMQMDGRFDGHVVQGHVDQVTECIERIDLDGSHKFWFALPADKAGLVVDKGSVSINGVSLTVSALEEDKFSVDIIPYTLDHTNFKDLNKGMQVNLEYDVIGKYVQRQLALRS